MILFTWTGATGAATAWVGCLTLFKAAMWAWAACPKNAHAGWWNCTGPEGPTIPDGPIEPEGPTTPTGTDTANPKRPNKIF